MKKEKDKRENLSPEEKTKRIVTWVSVFLLVVVIIVLILLLTLCDAKGDDITDGGNSGNGNNPVVECEHNIEILPAVAPTCEEKGLTEGKKCTKCDEIIVAQTEVPAIGHAYGQWESVDGLSHSRVCANDSTHVETEEHNWLTYDCTCHSCGFTDHAYDDVWIDNGENHIQSCVSCPYANIVEDHDFQLISTTPATCEDPEIFTYQCVCGKSYTEEGAPATGHSWGEWSMVDEYEHIRYCENGCYTAERSAHVVTDESRQYEPSCEYAGILIEWCALCGAVVRDEMLLPTGHDWSDWTDNGDGTCTRVCLNDSTHTETEPHVDENTDCLCDHCGSVEHDYPETWTDNGTNHIKVCVNGCGVNLTETHTHEETGRTPADCENAEVITYACVCGNTYTEEGEPAIGHDYELVDNGDGTHSSVCSNCEDVELTEDHNYVETGRTPADCENAEVITYACVCGNVKTEEGAPATDHAYPAEWTDNGENHIKVCENGCGIDLIEDHNYVETGRVDAVGCEDGSITYTCDRCGNSYEETIPAVHAYGEWMANGDGSSTRICANDSSHTETVKFISGNSLNLEKGTLVAFYVDQEVAEQYDNLTLEVVKPMYDENGAWVEDVVDTITNYDEIGFGSAVKLRFMYEGISAKEMGVEFTGKLYSNGVYLTEKRYSVKQYVYKTLENNPDHEAMRTLLVDMLNYGAAAQEYFEYLTDDLVNADLTEEQKAWATQEMAPLEETDTIVDGPEDSVQLHSTAISLVSVIGMNFIFSPGNHDIDDIIVVFTYTDLNGEEKQMEVDSSSLSEPPAGFDRYGVMFNEYGATQIRDEVRISFKSKATGEAIGDSGTYSIESYLASVSQKPDCSEEFLNLVDKMVKYGDSSRAYFER